MVKYRKEKSFEVVDLENIQTINACLYRRRVKNEPNNRISRRYGTTYVSGANNRLG